MKPTTIAGATLLAICTAGASAQFTPTDDFRQMWTGGFFTNVSGQLPGETYDPALPPADYVDYDAEHAMTYLGGTLECATSQVSSVSPMLLSASGEASVSFMGTNPNPDGSIGEAASFYTIVASLDEPAVVRIDATLVFNSTSPDAPGPFSRVHSRIASRFGQGFITYFLASNEEIGNDAGPQSFSVYLEPGEWLFQFAAYASAVDIEGEPFAESGSYDGTFTYLGVPCNRADLAVPMGVLDLADLMVWVETFLRTGEVANPSVDFNGDEVFDLQDVTGFVEAFLQGCGG